MAEGLFEDRHFESVASSELAQWAISDLLFVSVSKRVLLLNYCKGNEFDFHKNTQLIYI